MSEKFFNINIPQSLKNFKKFLNIRYKIHKVCKYLRNKLLSSGTLIPLQEIFNPNVGIEKETYFSSPSG